MQAHGYAQCVAHGDPNLETAPFIDLTAGYVQRAIDRFPRQGVHTPWRLHQNYLRDIAMLRLRPLEDGVLEFSARRACGGRARRAATLGRMSDDLVPRGGSRLSRSRRENRAYRLVVAGGVAGVVAAVGVVLAVLGVIGWTLPVLAVALLAVCALLFRRLVRRG